MKGVEQRIAALEREQAPCAPLVVFLGEEVVMQDEIKEAEKEGRKVICWPVQAPPIEGDQVRGRWALSPDER